MKKILLSAFLLIGIFTYAPAMSEKYTTLDKAVSTSVGKGKIEVIEVFWYGCGHCYSLEPHVQKWLKTKPKNVEFIRIPAPLNNFWEVHARIYYIEDALGIVDKFHHLVFDEIMQKNNYLDNKVKIADFFAKHGYDKQKILDLYDSFGINSAIVKAKSTVMGYKITSVPQIVVDGKYLVNAGTAKGAENIFPVVDELIQKISKVKK